MAAVGSIGLAGRVTAQLSVFDLLWVLLAISSAWSMLKKPALVPVAEQPEELPAQHRD
jgi:hypothetical protein